MCNKNALPSNHVANVLYQYLDEVLVQCVDPLLQNVDCRRQLLHLEHVLPEVVHLVSEPRDLVLVVPGGLGAGADLVLDADQGDIMRVAPSPKGGKSQTERSRLVLEGANDGALEWEIRKGIRKYP